MPAYLIAEHIITDAAGSRARIVCSGFCRRSGNGRFRDRVGMHRGATIILKSKDDLRGLKKKSPGGYRGKGWDLLQLRNYVGTSHPATGCS